MASSKWIQVHGIFEDFVGIVMKNFLILPIDHIKLCTTWNLRGDGCLKQTKMMISAVVYTRPMLGG